MKDSVTVSCTKEYGREKEFFFGKGEGEGELFIVPLFCDDADASEKCAKCAEAAYKKFVKEIGQTSTNV